MSRVLSTSKRRGATRSAEEALARLREHLPVLRQQYGVQSLWVVAPEQLAKPRTRPLLLVDLGRTRLSLIQFIALEQAIGQLIGKKILLLDKDDYKGSEDFAQLVEI